MLPLQNARKSAPRCDLQAARHADMEVGVFISLPACRTRRYKPPVRMIKPTEQREITPYKWAYPDEER
jgi:hypothetical protein